MNNLAAVYKSVGKFDEALALVTEAEERGPDSEGRLADLRKMIEEEDASRPLSDSRIASLLEKEGLPLARRTVAKYREELRIPPSNLRKTVH